MEVRYECQNCGQIFYPRPAPAIAALIVKENKLLLAKRALGLNKGKWTIPSGFVEYGEDPEETLKREIKEELGIQPTEYKLFMIKLGKNSPDKYILGIFYIVTKFKGEPRAVSSENSEISWFKFDLLPPIAFDLNQYVVNKFLKSLH